MDRNYKKGFTLIELLVVIAIIGILSAVVLASLNAARQRGSDASVKSSLNNSRAQAELYYASQPTPTYVGVCNLPSGAGAAQHAVGNLIGAAATAGAQTYNPTNPANGAGCRGNQTGWIAWVALTSPSQANGKWCVDGRGFSGEIFTSTMPGGYTCN